MSANSVLVTVMFNKNVLDVVVVGAVDVRNLRADARSRTRAHGPCLLLLLQLRQPLLLL